MTIHHVMWGVTLASLIGTLANVYRKRWCFWIWLVTNTAWSAYDWWIGAYSQSALMGVYAGLSVLGLIQWRKGKEAKEEV